MKNFVDECRREWRRLAVPDAVANEMAAELEADLRDAEADGLSPEEVLGDGVFDPRSFAAVWASERGVVPATTARARRSRRTLVGAVLGALGIAAIAAGVAVLAGRPTKEISIAYPFRLRPAIAHRLILPRATPPRVFWTPVGGKVPFAPKPVPVGLVRSGVDLQPVGWILLALGLAGLASSFVVWRGVPLRA